MFMSSPNKSIEVIEERFDVVPEETELLFELLSNFQNIKKVSSLTLVVLLREEFFKNWTIIIVKKL